MELYSYNKWNYGVFMNNIFRSFQRTMERLVTLEPSSANFDNKDPSSQFVFKDVAPYEEVAGNLAKPFKK